MQFQKFNPSKPYKHLVAYYWTLKSTHHNHVTYRFVPDAYVDWVFHLGTPWQCDFPNLEQQTQTRSCHVFGQIKNYIDLTLSKEPLYVFGVKFHPWVTHKLWNVDMHYLTDTCLELSQLDLPFINDLQEQIYMTASIQEKIKVIETYLKPYLDKVGNSELIHQNLNFGNKLMLKSASVGTRRLQQRFKEEIGISPKLFLRTLRINGVIEQMLKQPKQSLTQLAFDFNYFDQTHFIKDFKQFTGLNPNKFLKSINPDGDILNLRIQ